MTTPIEQNVPGLFGWKPHPGAIPTTPIIWPADRQKSNQIQQTKGSAKPQAPLVLPTTQPNQSAVAPRTTPGPVTDVRVISRPAVSGQKTIVVQFNHPPGDPYFAGASVYLRKTGAQPALVSAGSKSPLTFTVPVNAASYAVHVVSDGNWGSTDVLTSPSRPVRLL
jgi:hypothetical protein